MDGDQHWMVSVQAEDIYASVLICMAVHCTEAFAVRLTGNSEDE